MVVSLGLHRFGLKTYKGLPRLRLLSRRSDEKWVSTISRRLVDAHENSISNGECAGAARSQRSGPVRFPNLRF